MPVTLASVWMPDQHSTFAAQVDWLFYFIYWISVFFTALIAFLVVLFAWKYRQRGTNREGQHTHTHNTALEMTWTLAPTVLVLAIFLFGFRGYMNMATPPANAYDVSVTGRKWSWSFTYNSPYGMVVSDELHVPVGKPVRLVLESQDVIHSFFVPQFRAKKDVVPGRYNTVWFEATDTGHFDIYCAEYCGTRHSHMRSKVVVETPQEHDAWLRAQADPTRNPPLEAGKLAYTKYGCNACHTLDGTPSTGPSFKDLFGRTEHLADGTTVQVDEQYIHDSIMDPNKAIVAGFPSPSAMPTFQGRIHPAEVTGLITYLKSISQHYSGSIPTQWPADGGESAP